jgi:hypothetical protein
MTPFPACGFEKPTREVLPRVPDEHLADALELRLRDNVLLLEDGRGRHVQPGQFVMVRGLEEAEASSFSTPSPLTIEQGGLLRLGEPDRGLRTISDVPASLARLRRNQLIEAERDGNAWRVSWGKRALDIARKAGVPLSTK